MSKLSSLVVVLLGTCSSMIVTASDDSNITITKEQRRDWLTRLVNVLSTAPEYTDNSFAPKSDLNVSNKKRNYEVTDKKRYDLASVDQDENKPYLSSTFAQQGFERYANRVNVLDNEGLKNISAYVRKSNSYIKSNGKKSSLSSYIKHLYKRVRPWDIVGENGEYKQNFNKYKDAKHSISSYPSGHTWRGFQNGLSYALAFPEIGDEFISRSLQFGESRVIVGAHFPTDTIASRISNYYLLSELLSNDQIVADIAKNARIARDALKEECSDTVKNCLALNKKTLYNQYKEENDQIGYYGITRQDMSATQLKVEDMPKESEALLRFRFPYLNDADRLSIIASTAYPNNSLASWDVSRTDNDRYWGLIDLPKAYNGPSYLYQDMHVNQVDIGDLDFSHFGSFDIWNNAISGPGRLVKSGDGTLVLNGNDSFNGVTLNGGVLVVQGNSQYQGQSTVNGGHLVVNGKLDSGLDVNDKGTLSGNGTLKNVNVNLGAKVAPGNSVGDLRITNNITFNPGSVYQVEINTDNQSDSIHSDNTAIINGGTVSVSMEGLDRPLLRSEMERLLGRHYTILTAENGVSGKFDEVSPNYQFLGTQLNYEATNVGLTIGRSTKAFESSASTPNAVSVANALETMAAGNVVYESLLRTKTDAEADSLYQQLTGQIHSDVSAAMIDNSHLITNTAFERLQMRNQVLFPTSIQTSDDKRVWGKFISDWGHAKDKNHTSGYNRDNMGVLLGADSYIADNTLLGVMTGYTRTKVKKNQYSSAKTDNFHLGVYGSTGLGGFTLRAGGAYTWNNIDTSRHVYYGTRSESLGASYKNNVGQFFSELAYGFKASEVIIEPFVNFSYVHNIQNAFTEHGGYAALTADKESQNAKFSAVGLRAATQWKMAGDTQLRLSGELGWQHQYGSLDRNRKLSFVDGSSVFNTQSVPAAKESALVNTSVDVIIKKNTTVSVGYHGALSSVQQDNSVQAKISIEF